MLRRIKGLLLENRTTKQTVAKNTFWLFFGNVGSRLIKAGLIIYAARILGASEWGAFSYALSLAAFFTIFTDFGISAVINRESAKNISAQEKYFSTAIVIKAVMTALVIVLMILIAPLIVKQPEVLALLPIVIILVSFDGLRDFGASLSRAWEKMEIEAAIQILTNIAIVIAGIIALSVYASAYSLSWGYAIGVTIGMVGAFWPFRHYLKNLSKKFDRNLIKPILSASWPIGMSGLMTAIMLNTDTIMIGWFNSIADVGYYSAGQRIAQLLFLVPTMLITALFPSLAKFSIDKAKFSTLLEKSVMVLLMIGIPMAIGGALLARDIMQLIYGNQYLAGTLAFAIMCLTIIPGFVAPILGQAIFALNKERMLFTYIILGISGNFLFNLLLIPQFGIAGAAISTLLNQSIITVYLYYKLKQEAAISIRKKLSNILTASLVLFAITIGLSALGVPVITTIIVAAIAYAYILYVLQEPIFMEVANPVLRRIKNI